MGRTRLPEHIKRLIPAAERSQPKPKMQASPDRTKTAQDGASIVRAAMSESDFQKAVLKKARDLGWTVWHDAATNAPRVCYSCRAPSRGFQRNAKGLPDLILVRGPRIVWAELKRQDGVTSPEQRQWIADLRAAGQIVYVWRPSQWDSIVEVLT